MKFLNPLGLLLGLLLFFIILLYFKKKQIIEKKASNIAIWDEVIKEVEGIKSRKINQYLLLIIQLIIGGLIVLAFSKLIWIQDFKGEEITFAIDCSITMKSVEDGKTHFQMAKEKIENYMENVTHDKRMNLVLCKGSSSIYLKDAKKEEVKKAIKKLSCSNESLNIDYAREILKSLSGEKIIITDKDLSLGMSTIKVGNKFENVGITYANYDYYTDTLLCRIKNYGKSQKEVLIGLYDEQKRDLKRINLSGKEEMDVSFQGLKASKKWTLKIENEDLLKEDNVFVVALGEVYKRQVLFIGENLFLEKALLSIPYIHVEKQKIGEPIKKDYDLYIVEKEGNIQNLPQNANVWYLSPNLEQIDGKIKVASMVKGIKSPFTKDLDLTKVYTRPISYLKEKEGYGTILQADGKPIMIYGKEKMQRNVYGSIDFNKTNLVMMPDFPILVENTIDWFFDGCKMNVLKNPPEKLVVGEVKNIESRNESGKLLEKDFTTLLVACALLLMVLEWEVHKRAA
ncbi:BatA domain-containing protein [Crassaminicella profunda]|uniref:BatA domain-containing protein n=1 Tax=Crassaminicella profunda TaxID=1286698 RepID=UPI001CA68FCF|nr:BatA domain-containing protein [Crassaminicella profunda]QZY55688.1 BatA domain-containing protein [Crassaminicella profunda]